MAIYVDDRELVAAHQAGDTEAFDELVREYRDELLRHAYRKLLCESAAEDAVQETLVRAYRALPRFKGDYKLGAWLHRIMANVCVDEAVRRRRDGEKVDQFAAQPSVRSDAPSVEQELGLEFEDTELKAALDKLSVPHRDALVMRAVDGLEYEQVAVVSGISEQNARARVSRARVTMKGLLKGVASLPVLLVGLMKRGEKVAAAASASGVATSAIGSASSTAVTALPTLVETASVAAPVAMPAIAKAAVGIGIAASVLAPTSDSAVHRAVGDFVTGGSTTLVTEQSESEGAGDFDREGSNSMMVVSLNETLSPSIESEIQSVPAEQATQLPITAESPQTVIYISADQLTVRNVGLGEYQISGPIALTNATGILQGRVEQGSQIEVSTESDPEGRYRSNGLLLILLENGDLLEIRLAGFLWDQVADSQVGGLYRSVGDDGQLAERGSFDGQFVLTSDEREGSLALRLTS